MTSQVDAYIDGLSERQQKIATSLRKLIAALVDGVEEKFSYRIPFYHYYGMFCYINAIPDGIDLGFCRGVDFANEFPALEIKNRQIVATVSLYSIKDIQEKQVREIIITAALWNEEAKKKKIPLLKRKRIKT